MKNAYHEDILFFFFPHFFPKKLLISSQYMKRDCYDSLGERRMGKIKLFYKNVQPYVTITSQTERNIRDANNRIIPQVKETHEKRTQGLKKRNHKPKTIKENKNLKIGHAHNKTTPQQKQRITPQAKHNHMMDA